MNSKTNTTLYLPRKCLKASDTVLIVDDTLAMGGIAEALITTAAGLSISVMTVFPYNYFNTRIERSQDLIEMYASHLEITLGDDHEGECVG